MKKIDGSPIDYEEYPGMKIVAQIVLSKRAHGGWECDVDVNEEWIGGGTSPDAAGAYDMAMEMIDNEENPSESWY